MTAPRCLARFTLAAAATLAFLSGGTVQAQPPVSAGSPLPTVSNEYKLGSGNVLRITVYQNPDLTLETRVSEAGVLSFPLIGTVRLGGLSVTQAENLIASGLKSGNFVEQPQVTIVVLQVKGNQASVLAQVNRPGRFPIEVADMRLADLLANAGGVAVTGAETLVLSGTRNGQPYRLEVDLPSIFAAGGLDQDILIQNGDVVWVDRAPVVYIYGEVQPPAQCAWIAA